MFPFKMAIVSHHRVRGSDRVLIRERERGGNNEEGRRRVIISEDSDGHGFVGIPSVYLKYTKCRFAKIFKRFGSPGQI